MHETLNEYDAIIAELRQQARLPRVIRQGYSLPADPLESITREDVCELMPDLIRAFGGRRNSKTEHPLVHELIRNDISLVKLREMSGMTVSDFLSALSGGLSVLLVSKFERNNRDVESICAPVEVPSFRAYSMPHLDMPIPNETAEDAEVQTLPLKLTEAPQSGKLRSFTGKVRFSKAVWSSFGETLARDLVDYTASVAALIEQKLLAETLEAGTITTSASSGLAIAGMDKVAKAMRTALNGAGQPCNLMPAALIIPPALEMTARQLRQYLAWPELRIVVLPSLTSDTTWYCTCDPAVSPALVRLKLRNGGIPRLVSNARESGPETGMSFGVIHDVDLALSGSVGLIKATA